MIVGAWHGGFPRMILTLPGLDGPLDIEFIVDTGFEGDLVLPESLLSQLSVSPTGNQFVELAGGFRQRSYAYEMLIEWDGDLRLAEVLTLDGNPLGGNPLIGNTLWKGEMLQAENSPGGEVLFEPL